MIGPAMAKKLLGGAATVLGTAVDAVRHVAWYVTYHAEGRTHDAEDSPRRR